MNFPPSIRTVALVSPAGPSTPEKFDAGVNFLRSHGLKVKIMPHARGRAGYLAGSDTERAADLSAAWLDDEVDMIVCARGGYGCARIIDRLDWKKLAARAVTVVGYSDITALHWAMERHGAGRAMAAPMLGKLTEMDAFTAGSFSAVLAGRSQTPPELTFLRRGSMNGKILAGNLTVAASLAGTGYFPDASGRIIVLEDVNEAPYRLDRSLNQLRQAGLFDRCAGVVFGRFTACGTTEEIDSLLENFTGSTKCPVARGLEFGHEFPLRSIDFSRPVSFGGDI